MPDFEGNLHITFLPLGRFNCPNADKAHTYLERSNPSPINLWIDRKDDLSPHDPLLQIILHATGRLKSLSIEGTPGNLQDVTTSLSLSAPLLEDRSIDGGCQPNPALTSKLFNGDPSSLRKLCLRSVHTELPWRGMANLMSLTLGSTTPGDVSVLLDFFESAPRLHEVVISTISTSGAQVGRLVSPANLEMIYVLGGRTCSLLLDHLLTPVDASLTTRVDIQPWTPGLLPQISR